MAFVILYPQLPHSWDCRLAQSCPAPDLGTYKEQRFTSNNTRSGEVKAKGLRPDENLHNGWQTANTTGARTQEREREEASGALRFSSQEPTPMTTNPLSQ